MNGKKLKALRTKLQHSQATLAAELGLSMRQIIRYECEGKPIPKAIVMALRLVNTRKRGASK